MLAWNLDTHVMGKYDGNSAVKHALIKSAGGYEFLMQNCAYARVVLDLRINAFMVDIAGDRICIFGPSPHRITTADIYIDIDNFNRIFSRSIYGTEVAHFYSDPIRYIDAQSSLAGMIHKVGLLPADNKQQVPFAYKMYTRTDSAGWDQSNGFKKAFSVTVPIHFVGVWYHIIANLRAPN